jgi:hypothetical protein
VGPKAGLDTVVKRKIPGPRQGSNPDHPARSLVAIPTEPSRLSSFVSRFVSLPIARLFSSKSLAQLMQRL